MNNMLGVNSRAERKFCNTLCMCRLTLVWILAKFYKATGMQTHLPSLWLDPHVMLTRLFATVSGVDRLCPCPVANCPWAPLSNQLSSRVPLPLPVTPGFQVQNPLSGFAPKQTKESSAWRATYIVFTYLPLLPLTFIHNKLQHNSTTIRHYASQLIRGENKITIKQQANKKHKHLLAVTT